MSLELVFFLEGRSEEELLKGLIPRLKENLNVRYVVFEGKQDLQKQIVRRLKGYNSPSAKFVILIDKDSADCLKLKKRLKKMCTDAGKPNTLIRIACHEIESWYLADLNAVGTALEIKNLANQQNKSNYIDPDKLSNAADELEKLTDNKYQKIIGSRKIAVELDLKNSRSHSFCVFISGIRHLLSESESG